MTAKLKDETRLILRITAEQKQRWRMAASHLGYGSLSEFVRHIIYNKIREIDAEESNVSETLPKGTNRNES